LPGVDISSRGRRAPYSAQTDAEETDVRATWLKTVPKFVIIGTIPFLGLTLSVAVPTTASASGVSAATITVLGGTLSITVPVDAGNLGTRANSVSGGTISGPLGQVQVNDARSPIAGSGWVASVISSAFIPATGTAIAASAVAYSVGPITKVGTATYTANDPPNLTGVSPAVTATGITGDNSATWNPTITVTVPGGMAATVYAATITHSVV
jgi:hypothetical protein